MGLDNNLEYGDLESRTHKRDHSIPYYHFFVGVEGGGGDKDRNEKFRNYIRTKLLCHFIVFLNLFDSKSH